MWGPLAADLYSKQLQGNWTMCTGPHAYIPVLNTAKTELFFRSDDQIVENVFHILNTEAWTPTTLQAINTFFNSWMTTYYKACMSQTIALFNIKSTDLSAQTGAVVEYAPATPIAGTAQGGEQLPLNVAAVIKWTTSQRGRSYHGRTYVPGLDTSVVTINTLDTALVTAITSAASGLWSGIRDEGWSLAVVSYCNNKTWRTTGVATPIIAYSVDPHVNSQRRRLPGRGT